MLREFGSHKAFLAVISGFRPDAAAYVERSTQQFGPATWIVPEDQADEYLEAGAPAVATDAGEGVTPARNVALEMAWNEGVACAQLDDDMVSCARADPVTKRSAKLGGAEATGLILDALFEHDCYLGSPNRSFNPFYVTREINFNVTVSGGLFVVRPCDVWFDELLPVSEDVDYGLAHYARYGRFLRYDAILMEFEHLEPGGCVRYRDDEMLKRAALRMRAKYPGLLIPRPRPENPYHQFYRIPKAQRVVLD